MKTILVKEVYRLQGKASITIPEDAGLDYLVALFGHEPHLQGVFFVDSNNRFSGMVSRFDLLRFFRLYGGTRGKEMLSEFLGYARTKKAKDLELPEVHSFSVKVSDSLQSALDLMIGFEQDVIPVLDEAGKILGDLSLSELLLKALETERGPQA